MIYLILGILASMTITTVFKFFDRYNIDTFQAIVYNYIVCVITGSIFLGEIPISQEIWQASWQPYALANGLLFISGFYLVGQTVIHFGLAVASIVQRMSLIISVPFAIIVMHENESVLKYLGIAIALLSVILINMPRKEDKLQEDPSPADNSSNIHHSSSKIGLLFYPIFCLLISGAIECIIQYAQGNHMQMGTADEDRFSIYLFGFAGAIGLVVLIINVLRGTSKIAVRHMIAGVALGVPNYFSIYFLIMAFSWKEKSIVLPIFNISIVAGLVLLGFFFFKEKLSTVNWLGVLSAIVALVMIAFA
ncbi:MAG: hypothetical protein MK212_06465 [Saprospiraceae bacterium]|nr:hypothetical protein [Saprospiraceae bacterium]